MPPSHEIWDVLHASMACKHAVHGMEYTFWGGVHGMET